MRHFVMAVLLFVVTAPLAGAPSDAPPQMAETKAAVRTSPVGVGDMAPDFALADHRGGTARLSAPGDAKATVLVFYRGYW
jgi:hypothetical protein